MHSHFRSTRTWYWPQIYFETFDRYPKIKPQEANTDTVITTTLEKGGCSLRTQRITTKQAEQRTGKHRTKRQENETLHFYRERWQEHLDRVYRTVEVQRNIQNVKQSSNKQTAEETAAKLSAVSKYRTRPVWYRTRPEIPDSILDTSDMLDSTERLLEKKIKNPSKWWQKIMRF
jgi:flagellar biosynthesis GTPase FlhF